MGGRRNQVAHLSFLDVTMDVENFSKNITHLTCITASTGRGDVDDIEKDIIYAVSSNATIDLFSLYILFSHFRPRDALMGIFLLFFH